jgi:hypothetical protein
MLTPIQSKLARDVFLTGLSKIPPSAILKEIRTLFGYTFTIQFAPTWPPLSGSLMPQAVTLQMRWKALWKRFVLERELDALMV